MKISDYVVVSGGTAEQLQSAVRDLISEGWEISGNVQIQQRPWRIWQMMYKGVHDGERWEKVPGKRGKWVKDV